PSTSVTELPDRGCESPCGDPSGKFGASCAASFISALMLRFSVCEAFSTAFFSGLFGGVIDIFSLRFLAYFICHLVGDIGGKNIGLKNLPEGSRGGHGVRSRETMLSQSLEERL